MIEAFTKTTTAACDLANELFGRFRAQSQEAEQLALQMIKGGEARLKLEIVLAGDEPTVTLLLEPIDGEGMAVEIAASRPVQPTVEGFAGRAWFFSRLSHWHLRH